MSTRTKQLPGDIEPPARHVHMTDEPIPMPSPEGDGEKGPVEGPEKPEEPKE